MTCKNPNPSINSVVNHMKNALHEYTEISRKMARCRIVPLSGNQTLKYIARYNYVYFN